MKKTLSIISLLSIFAACSQEKNSDKPVETKPTTTIFLADPTIFYNNGLYYLYGTTSGNFPNGEGFQVYTSSDLNDWKGPAGAQNGLALKKGEAFGDKGFWAPQILQYKNKFYMIYTANENIAVASSDNPLGPFKNDSKEPIIKTGNQIDPFIFIDEDGKKYLYHVRLTNGNRIFVAEINDDLQSIKPETLTECISGTLPWENTQNASWPVTEGPTVIKHNGLYYMLYSANDFRNPDYAVGYATSKSPLGPWEKSKDSPIISRKNTNQNGIGHGDVFWDKNNKMHYVLHTHFSQSEVSPRKAGIIDIYFDGDLIKAESSSFKFLNTK
ncbi:glycoside hydrolase family 43 protein [Flavobacterium sp. HJJ]|uniref:glycoside hydrolase family 43 protein n=1 Tax=Flavobacterium sp. HJJ TaxID=2783792 RepID=UPI00188C6C84|nr:glycoside hydrolase family 43 protein [Flavobacterium sp. HJJ]MBF4470357.1 glycoside hydrolase family 43 protein [Flavobacterium sp. HJJ]